MSINSKDKGKRGERMARDWLNKHLVSDAQRGQQHKGGKESADIQSESLQNIGLHPEVKFDNTIYNKSVEKLPEVETLYRGDGSPYLVFIRASALVQFCEHVVQVNGYHKEPSINKRVCNTSLIAAIKQAERDCGEYTPFLMIKGNRKPWIFVVRYFDILDFAVKITTIKNEKT